MRRSTFSGIRSRCTVSFRRLLAHARGLSLAGALALLPPSVLPLPSRSGPEGPPQPYGTVPRVGPQPPPTSPSLARAQDRLMLEGPFQRGGLARGVSDGTLFKSSDAATRALAFQRAQGAGAQVARITVDWRNVVAAAPPAGFDARDPSSPGYEFATIDAAVKGAVTAGLEPLLVVFHAPAFAEAPGRWPYAYLGSWAPDPRALEAFAAALAERYDGSFPDPAEPARTLPRVRLLQAWNEPNLPRYLEPQFVVRGGRWSAFSVPLYRQMLDGFYRGVKSVAPSDTVIAAGVAPNGEREGLGRMAPVSFLRALLCLAPRHGGGLARAPGCTAPVRLDALAFHPLSVEDPDQPASSSLDVSIADAAKVTRLLRAAERLRTVPPARPRPVWVTELNWESAPPAAHGVPAGLQAAWVSRALHRLWAAGVSLVAWQFLADPFPATTVSTPTGGVQEYPRPAGLFTDPSGDLALAAPKPFVAGFSFPFDPLRVDRGHVRIWAVLRASGEQAELLGRRPGGAWRLLAAPRAGADQIVNRMVSLRGPWQLRLRSGGSLSPEARVGARRWL